MYNDVKQLSRENEVMTETNGIDAFLDENSTIPKLFGDQVQAHPDRIAVVFGEQTLTYHELNEKANAVAIALRKKGIGRESIVGIICERSLEMIIGMYGIIKAGGAYLPISTYDPSNRISLILEDSQAKALLIKGELKSEINYSGPILNLSEFTNVQSCEEEVSLINKNRDLMYVIYTSGSTGIPKGVMIEHRSVINRLKWMQEAYPITTEDTILQKTPYNFDVSVWEFFWWALEGARMCFLKPNDEKNPLAIADCVQKNNITIMHFVPSMLGVFLEYLKDAGLQDTMESLRIAFASGERLTTKHVMSFNELLNNSGRKRLVNLYGPTEATVDVTHYDCTQGEVEGKIPIGKAISHTQLYIVDDEGKQLEAGIPGELIIAGIGVARGYLRRAELTAERFIDNPYVPGEKMYKTGDLARQLSDGNIEYINRLDNQVKIRGLRIELGEIEAVLVKHEAIKDCIVNCKQYSESVVVIVAYYVSDVDIPVIELKARLSKDLPDYMMPGKFIRIDKIPLTSNGKADRKSLPDPF